MRTKPLAKQQRLPCQAGLRFSLAKQQLLLRKETHHQRARLGDLLTPGVARVNEKKELVSTKKTIEYY